MELYIKVSFWIGVFAFVLRLGLLAVCDWPREREPESVGEFVFGLLLGLLFTLWAGSLLLGHS